MGKNFISMGQLYNIKRNLLAFDGDWKAFVGEPELSGTWLIYGHSGNGKTSFAMQLAKYLTRFAKVAYNSLEESTSKSIENACRRERMEEVSRKFKLGSFNYEDLRTKLRSKRSPDIVIIDSLQYFQVNYSKYIELKEEFPNKLFIYISHAEGKHPEGRVAKRIKYDAHVKIMVQNYVAVALSRYGGGQPYVIWPEKAEELGEI